MELKFKVKTPEKSFRSLDGKTSFEQSSLIILDECMESLESQIVVTGIPDAGKGMSKLIVPYYEKYEPETTFSDFYLRAEKFARDYCAAIGIGATKISDTQRGVTCSGRMAINISKPNKISIFDGDGKLRCVLGPIDIAQNQVLINDASIELARISNAIITNAETVKAQDDALKNSIREVVEELLDKASRPGGAIWRAIKNF